MNKDELDLSLIKENDLDNTSAFDDLMTRTERKKYLEEKKKLEDETVEFRTEDLMEHISEDKNVEEKIEETDKTNIEENKKNKKNKKDKKKKNKKNKNVDDMEEIINEKEEETEEVIEEKKEPTGVISINPEEKKEIIEELKKLTEDDDDELLIEKNPGFVNNIFLSIFYLGIVAYYVYLNITNQSISDKYVMYIDYGLIAITLNYCISMITIKKAHIIFSLFTYLLYIAYIALNVLLFFKVI